MSDFQTCNDTSLRQYCCRTCEVSLPEPSTGSPFKPNSLSVKVALRHRMLWTVGGSPGPTGYCRIGDAWLPIRRINDTLIECQIPSLQAQIDDAARASIGSSNAVGIGVANESIPLNVKPHETGREQQAWYYASGASQDPYSNVVGEVRITVVCFLPST